MKVDIPLKKPNQVCKICVELNSNKGWLVDFYGIANLVDYLMPNLSYD